MTCISWVAAVAAADSSRHDRLLADIDSWLSTTTPRFHTVSTTNTSDDSTGTSPSSTLANCWADPSHITWVLLGLSRSRLAFSQASTSTRHASRQWVAIEAGGTYRYSCKSSAYWYALTLCSAMMSNSELKYRECTAVLMVAPRLAISWYSALDLNICTHQIRRHSNSFPPSCWFPLFCILASTTPSSSFPVLSRLRV